MCKCVALEEENQRLRNHLHNAVRVMEQYGIIIKPEGNSWYRQYIKLIKSMDNKK